VINGFGDIFDKNSTKISMRTDKYFIEGAIFSAVGATS
jgi:hypothetical protein